MQLVTTEQIPGREYRVLGLVRGSTIQTKHLGKDITQSFKTLVGGELKAYTEMMDQARDLATRPPAPHCYYPGRQPKCVSSSWNLPRFQKNA